LFVLEAHGGIVKAVLATALLVGFSSFTAAHAEREILDPGTAVAKVVTAHRPSLASEIMWPAPSIVVSTVSTKKEDALSSTAICRTCPPGSRADAGDRGGSECRQHRRPLAYAY
jgi:hypothetical protein